MKAVRDSLSMAHREIAAQEAAARAITVLPITDYADPVVALYYPIGPELDPRPLMPMLWEKGVSVVLPVTSPEIRALQFQLFTPTTPLRHGAFGIAVPDDPAPVMCRPDMLLVPLLAFDSHGHRMGYGRGHYDETLRILRETAPENRPVLAVGFAYDAQYVVDGLPVEPHDQRLDMVVTPRMVFDFRAETG